MSKIALTPNASGTGTFTIASPNSNTDRTLTLPDVAGEILTTAGGTLTGALTGTDLTLSGGVYLGGTGSANLLDDYEEGTWTPTITSQTNMSSASWSQGAYRKIGSVVTIQGSFTCTVTSSNTLTYVELTLPFTTTIGNQTGSAFANNNVHVGVCDLTTTQISPFFPAASGITSGSEVIQVSATYIVS